MKKLVNGMNWGLREQILLDVTDSGKTFTKGFDPSFFFAND